MTEDEQTGIINMVLPDTDNEKLLGACLDCRYILSEKQWKQKDMTCPNCQSLGAENYTHQFSGMISMMQPSQSWVCLKNNLSTVIEGENGEKIKYLNVPGIYAIEILEDAVDGPKDDYGPVKTSAKRGAKRALTGDEWESDGDFIQNDDEPEYNFRKRN